MITQAFDLNLIPGGVKPVVKASQYDADSRTLSISLFAGVSAFPVPSGAQVLIQGTKQDGTGFQYECTAAGNVVSAEVTQQMTAFAGPVEVELQILSGGEVLGTGNFILQVEQAALSDDTIISETDIPIIQRIPEYVAEAQAAAEEAALWNDNGGDSGSSVPGETNNAYYWAMQAQSESARHRIIGPTGTTMPNEAGLQFKGMSVSDDETNDRTVVTAVDSEALIKDTVGWTGKNLIPYPYTEGTETDRGVTWTDNGDGTVTASGTATSDSAHNLTTRDNSGKLYLRNGHYILTGCPSNGSSATYYMDAVITKNGAAYRIGLDAGKGADIEITGDDYGVDGAYVLIRLTVKSGTTVSNLTFYPMLRNADILNDDYEPYHDTVAEELNQIYEATSVQNATGDSLALVPTSAGNALPITIYGMSTQDGTPTPSTPVAIESSSADFKCVGKNLIPYPYRAERIGGNPITYSNVTYTANSDGTLTASGTASNGNANYYLTDWRDGNDGLIKAGTYTLSGCPAGGNTTTYCLILYCFQVGTTNGTEVSPVVHIFDEGNGATFTLTEDVWGRIYFRVANGTAAPSAPIKPVLRLASVTDATYEPYKHTDITTSLTLRSIEVTSTDPYNLVKDGHYYIADTIDWDEVDGYVLTRRVKETVFDGTEADWTTGTPSVSGVVLFRKAGFFDYNTNTKFATKCNRFVCISSYSDPNRNYDGYISLAASNYAIYFGMLDSVASTVDQFKTWLSTNNVTVLSEQIPTKTSLTSAQAKALLSMRTYDESTSIDAVNAPAPVMELEYAKTRTPALALTGHNMAHINAIDIGDL